VASGDSVEREIRAQHRRLDALFEDARDAFADEEASEAAREAFGVLHDALATHFDQEERLYYPAIWALRPERKAELEAIVASHGEFRVRLDAIGAHLARRDLAKARRSFDHLTQAFGQHESAEERVLAELDRELAAAR